MEESNQQKWERYIQNLRRVRTLSRPQFPPETAPEILLEAIQGNAVRCFDLMKENNALLGELVYTRDAKALSDSDIAELEEAADRLFTYANSEDCGIAYKIHALLLDYARLAVTEENVALLARQALAARGQVNASTLVEEYPNDFTGIIGLHTYSQSPHREYDITMTGNWVERGGFRFQDFVLTRRKEVNTDGNH